VGGRGSSSGFGGSGGWVSMPELTGSERQVSWANDIRQNIMDSIDFNIRSSSEHYERTRLIQSMIRRDLYQDAKSELSGILQNTTRSQDIINMRNRLDPIRLSDTIRRMSTDMTTQISNGWEYDRKTHRTRRKR